MAIERGTEVQKVEDIAYVPGHGFRGLGDLYLPDEADGAPAALVIHGGGWNAMDKQGLAGVAQFLAETGYGAYAINYRLLDDAPWPACGDDCLTAAGFLLAGGHEAMKPLDRSRLVVIGGSAGGHLAMMTGLRLPPIKVRCIVSIAGPADLKTQTAGWDATFLTKFFGPDVEITDETMLAASPVQYVRADSPPLLCTNSTNDKLVPIAQSHAMVERYRQNGGRAELYAYPGPGEQHGIWIEGSDPHRLLPELEQVIEEFLQTI
ncbi:MAG TPA: alpha/beta hydrolase [Phycisphaerae bacterium]|nr:alpha/beta hydrolase [Phycisphaerae bacterium]